MSNTVDYIGTLAGHNYFFAFLIIYLVTIFLGNISAFASLWIVFRGYLGPFGVPILLVVIFAAEVSGDMLWFSLGHSTRNTRFGDWIHGRLPGRERLEKAIKQNGKKWIILSKFIYAAAFPITFLSGWIGMEYKRFWRISIISVSLVIPIILGFSYGLISSLSPLGAISMFRDFEIIFFVGLALFLLLDFFFAKFLMKTFGRNDEFTS